MTAGPLLIRADASISIGTGHVMRCLALAQAWQDSGGQAAFAMAETTPAIRDRLRSESCDVIDLPAAAPRGDEMRRVAALAREGHENWVVLDGYQFTADDQRALKAEGLKTLFVDDYGQARHYASDVVVNQNLGATAELYRERDPQTRLLLGPRYALLRREFDAWRDWERDVSPVCRRVLVMMGGSDPENLTARVMAALALMKNDGPEVTVVVGEVVRTSNR